MKEHGVLSGKAKMARNRLTREQRADLIMEHKAFIKSVVKKYCPMALQSLYLDDMVSEAYLRIFDALALYKACRDHNVRAYIGSCAQNASIDYARKMRFRMRSSRRPRLGNPLYILSIDHLEYQGATLDPGEVCADEHLMSPDRQVMLKDIVTYVLGKLRRTKGIKYKVVLLHFFEDLSMKKIGEIFSVTESRICQIINDFTKRMRSHLVDRLGLSSYDFVLG